MSRPDPAALGGPPHADGRDGGPDPDQVRGRATLRRGALAGALVGGLVGLAGLVAVTATGAGGRDGAVVVLFGLVAGLLVAAGWLLVAVLVDLLAGRRPVRRVLVATAVAVAAAFVSPVLALGALAG